MKAARKSSGGPLKSLIGHRALLVGIGGIVVLATSYILESLATEQAWTFWLSGLAVGLPRAIGGSMLLAGMVSVGLEWQWTMEYVEQRLQGALNRHGPEFLALFDTLVSREIDSQAFLKNLSRDEPDKADRVHANLIKIANGIEFPVSGSFYRLLKRDIEPLLGLPHYEELDITIDNTVIDEHHMLSHRTWTATLHSWTDVDMPLKYEKIFRAVDGVKPDELWQVLSFRIDGKPAELPLKPAELTPHGYRVCAGHTVHIPADTRVVVEREELLHVPLDDVLQWHVSPGRSLKSLRVGCHFDRKVNPRVSCRAFGDDLGRSRRIVEKQRYCTLQYDGWMLPFQGFVIRWDVPTLSEMGGQMPLDAVKAEAAKAMGQGEETQSVEAGLLSASPALESPVGKHPHLE